MLPLWVPCRYVSGYVHPREEMARERSADGATHAWVEALLPGLGWVGFDPTSNLVAHPHRHRTRLRRRAADQGHLQGRRSQ
jgi:transglutaminase-like putative cysteine protease